jgi:hypothetical protein
MLVLRPFSIALAILGSTIGVSCSSEHKYSCDKPAVRKEWRKLSAYEKAEWIRAVNVRMDASLRIVQVVMLTRSSGAVPFSPAS